MSAGRASHRQGLACGREHEGASEPPPHTLTAPRMFLAGLCCFVALQAMMQTGAGDDALTVLLSTDARGAADDSASAEAAAANTRAWWHVATGESASPGQAAAPSHVGVDPAPDAPAPDGEGGAAAAVPRPPRRGTFWSKTKDGLADTDMFEEGLGLGGGGGGASASCEPDATPVPAGGCGLGPGPAVAGGSSESSTQAPTGTGGVVDGDVDVDVDDGVAGEDDYDRFIVQEMIQVTSPVEGAGVHSDPAPRGSSLAAMAEEDRGDDGAGPGGSGGGGEAGTDDATRGVGVGVGVGAASGDVVAASGDALPAGDGAEAATGDPDRVRRQRAPALSSSDRDSLKGAQRTASLRKSKQAMEQAVAAVPRRQKRGSDVGGTARQSVYRQSRLSLLLDADYAQHKRRTSRLSSLMQVDIRDISELSAAVSLPATPEDAADAAGAGGAAGAADAGAGGAGALVAPPTRASSAGKARRNPKRESAIAELLSSEQKYSQDLYSLQILLIAPLVSRPVAYACAFALRHMRHCAPHARVACTPLQPTCTALALQNPLVVHGLFCSNCNRPCSVAARNPHATHAP